MFQLLASSGRISQDITCVGFDHTIMMGTYCNNLLCNFYHPNYSITNDVTKFCRVLTRGNSLCQNPVYSGFRKHHFDSVLVGVGMEQIVKEEVKEGNERRYRWIEVGKNVTKEQQQAISKLPFRMADRSKALMRQIICFSAEKGTISDLLRSWVKLMKPTRADWLSVLKELRTTEHPFYLEVFHIFCFLDSMVVVRLEPMQTILVPHHYPLLS